MENIGEETFQASIKAIRIGKKQMTIAVFRQLPIRYMWWDTNDLTGLYGEHTAVSDVFLWGSVRYEVKSEFNWKMQYFRKARMIDKWIIGTVNGELCKAPYPEVDDDHPIFEKIWNLPQLYIAV